MSIHGLGGSHVPPDNSSHRVNQGDEPPKPKPGSSCQEVATWIGEMQIWVGMTSDTKDSGNWNSNLQESAKILIHNWSYELEEALTKGTPPLKNPDTIVDSIANVFETCSNKNASASDITPFNTAASELDTFSQSLANYTKAVDPLIDNFSDLSKAIAADRALYKKLYSTYQNLQSGDLGYAIRSEVQQELQSLNSEIGYLENQFQSGSTTEKNLSTLSNKLKQFQQYQGNLIEISFTVFGAGNMSASDFNALVKKDTPPDASSDPIFQSLTEDYNTWNGTNLDQINQLISQIGSQIGPPEPDQPFTPDNVGTWIQQIELCLSVNYATGMPYADKLPSSGYDFLRSLLEQYRAEIQGQAADSPKLIQICKNIQISIESPLQRPTSDNAAYEQLFTAISSYSNGVTKQKNAQATLNAVLGKANLYLGYINQTENCINKLLALPKLSASEKAELQSAQADLKKYQQAFAAIQKNLDNLQKIMDGLNEDSKNLLQAMNKLFDDGLGSASASADLKNIENISSQIIGVKKIKANQDYQIASRVVKLQASNVQSVMDQVIALRKQLSSEGKANAPPTLPQGQIYLGGSYLQFVMGASDWKTQLDNFLDALQKAGVNTINLYFAQIASIGGKASQDDTIMGWINQNPTQWENFASTATSSKYNFKLDMSFGGGSIAASDWTLPTNKLPNGDAPTPANCADYWVNHIMSDPKTGKLLIKSADFDIELNTFRECFSSDDDIRSFFKEFHDQMQAKNGSVSLTTLQSFSDSLGYTPSKRGPFNPNDMNATAATDRSKFAEYPLFFDDKGGRIFSTMFDGMNFMSYSQTESYLDANNTTWGIAYWLNVMGGNMNAGNKINGKFLQMIHMGFEDNVDYITGGASQTPLNAQSQGQAAAMRYIAFLNEMKADGFDWTRLGGVFTWPDTGVSPPDEGKMPETQFETDFWTYYNNWNELNNGL